jgi:hypothetical protein
LPGTNSWISISSHSRVLFSAANSIGSRSNPRKYQIQEPINQNSNYRKTKYSEIKKSLSKSWANKKLSKFLVIQAFLFIKPLE